MNDETWCPVVGFEREYEVSDQGRVRRSGRAARNGKGRGGGARVGHIRKNQPHKGGYRGVMLWRNGKNYLRLVHTLVAHAFLGPAPERHEVNHHDGNKANNCLTNLEYVTRSQNMQHAYRTGLRSYTEVQLNGAHARRKPRLTVLCACGCEALLETPDKKGRDRSFLSGHNNRKLVVRETNLLARG